MTETARSQGLLMINSGMLLSFPLIPALAGKEKFGGSYSSAGFIFDARHDSLVTLTSKPAVRVQELHFAMNNLLLNKIPIQDSLFSAPLLIAFQNHQFHIFRQGGLKKITSIPLDPVLCSPMSITGSNFRPNNRISRTAFVPWEGTIEISGRENSPKSFKFRFILKLDD